MDGLIVLLVIIGLLSSFGSSSRKKKQARRHPFRTEVEFPKAAAREKAEALKPEGIPFGHEEWKQIVKKSIEREAAQPKPVQAEARPSEAKMPENPVKIPHAAGSLKHDAPEGTISTQGESHAEHAQHRSRILEAEQALHEEQENLRRLRRMNLQKLRSAVVMSEVLGKPVSLRSRSQR